MSVGEVSFAVVWPILSILSFIAALIVNSIATLGVISNQSVGDVSRKYELMITPSNWTFSIWGIIYAWQFLWLLYILILCCKEDMKSIILDKMFYISFIISNLLNIAWIISWTKECIVLSAILLILITICLYICVITSHFYVIVKASGNGYYDYDSDVPYWLDDRVLSILVFTVLNGTAFYAQWVMIAACINFGVVLCYNGGVLNETASFVSLGILTVLLIIYWCFEFNRKFGKLLKFTYAPYIVLVLAFSGILSKHGIDAENYPPSIMVLILLIMTCIASAFKVYSSCCRVRYDQGWNDSFLSVDY